MILKTVYKLESLNLILAYTAVHKILNRPHVEFCIVRFVSLFADLLPGLIGYHS